MNKQIEKIKNKINDILKTQDIVYAGIFGSYAKGLETEKSDIDILIEQSPNSIKSYFKLARIENSLKQALGKEVDLITMGGINKNIKEEVLNSTITIFDERQV